RLQAKHPYLVPGSKFHFGRRNWSIVGTFTDNGSARESEIWTDFDDLKVDVQTTDKGCGVVHVVLKAASADAFKEDLKKDGRLIVDAITEKEYYASQSKVAGRLESLGFIVALALGIGATFGGMNTMYTAVARREREIGVLRAIGFTRRDVLSSFV